ncbi:unnamed protein product [Ostreobium quekettii]|uniref:Uncharacterized protein n=1 Tax=Ostreobium quekettii TaxID=121088 RepID=A0A8S1INM5_9CHLO|nr:unnamed protein product [Ostreobium quekettii]
MLMWLAGRFGNGVFLHRSRNGQLRSSHVLTRSCQRHAEEGMATRWHARQPSECPAHLAWPGSRNLLATHASRTLRTCSAFGIASAGLPGVRTPRLPLRTARALGSNATAAVLQRRDEAGEDGPLLVMSVEGMKCANCVARVKKLIEENNEVAEATVNLAVGTAFVQVTTGKGGNATSIGRNVAEVLTNNGYPATLSNGAQTRQQAPDNDVGKKWKTLTAIGIPSAFLAASMLAHVAHVLTSCPPWLQIFGSMQFQFGLSLALMLGPARNILSGGVSRLLRRSPDMDTLVGMGAIAAFAMSCVSVMLPRLGWPAFFHEPAMLLSVVLLGRALEAFARTKASDDLTALHKLLPDQAKVVWSGKVHRVPIQAVGPGMEIVVGPGDQIPVDGIVTSGSSAVNESAVSGEAMPIPKSPGDKVIAGTINCGGMELRVDAQRVGQDTAMARIVRLVEECQGRTPSIQRLADSVAGIFSWGVLAASGMTALFWLLMGPILLPQVASGSAALLLSAQLACNVLVVSCPCALGLATPTAVLVGTSLAARSGLVIGGGDVLERAGKVDAIVFDKTGTITIGRPAVSSVVVTSDGHSQDAVLALAGAVEQQSTHPLAQAIVSACKLRKLEVKALDTGSFRQEISGGVEGCLDGSLLEVGSMEWLEQRQKPDSVCGAPNLGVEENKASTMVHVRYDGRVIGAICIEDEVRSEAAGAISRLRNLGVKHVVMASGDHRGPCLAIAREVGIRGGDVFWRTSPEEKVAIVKRLQAKGYAVAVVGDGINDAASLAQADVGMAMSGGLASARSASDIVLSGNSVAQVPEVIELSRAILGKIRENLAWAFGYNVVAIPVAAGALLPGYGVMLTPSISGALMGMSSLAVVTNSLSLQLRRKAGR